jgi:hypothetical protein
MLCRLAKEKFISAPVPPDIQAKRDKLEQKAKSAADEKISKPKKVNIAALIKKIESQLEGIALGEKLLSDIAAGGMGSLNPQKLKDLSEQSAKLGDYYLPGLQKEFRELLHCFANISDDPESAYDAGMTYMLELGQLLKNGQDYLTKKAADPVGNLDFKTEIEAQLGHAWQLSELAELGLCQEEARLMQLSFFCYDNLAAKQYEDIGLWLDLGGGKIYLRQNFRPHKAAKHIQQEDTQNGILPVSKLYIYPGGLNPRVRWEGAVMPEAVKPEDYARALELAQSDYAAAVKFVKEQLKNPLSDKNPYALLSYANIGKAGEGCAIESPAGQRIELCDAGEQDIPDTLRLLEEVKPAGPGAALCRFKLSAGAKRLLASPLGLVSENKLIRLAF